MKYTIVVPLYNCENYIAKCLDSLVEQTFRDFEVIIVNDGSTDNSLSVAIGYEKENANIRVVNQTNQGLSGARNTGIKEALGEYILFIDADDYVERTLLEEVYNSGKNKDVVFYGYYNDAYVNEVLSNQKEVVFDNAELGMCFRTMKSLAVSALIGYAWNKAYKVRFIRENNLKFREGTSLIEDILFNAEVMKKMRSSSVICKPLLHYIQRMDRQTLSTRKYKNLKVLLVESFRCRKQIFAYYRPNDYKASITDIFEFQLIYLLNRSGLKFLERVKECEEYVDECSTDIEVDYIKNKIIKVCLRKKLYYILVLGYTMKNMLRR